MGQQLAVPSRQNDYKILPGHSLAASLLDGVFSDISARLKSAEASLAGIDSDAAQKVQRAITAATDQLSDLVTNQRAGFQAINAKVIEAEGKLQSILAGGVAGENVSISGVDGLTADNTKAAIAELLGLIKVLQAGSASLTQAIAGKKNVDFIELSANADLEAGKAYFIDATDLTLTLPANPSKGDAISLVFGEAMDKDNPVTIARNAKTIMGLAEDVTVGQKSPVFVLRWSGADWRIL
ncbi:MAG: hypothetical protein OIF56_14960 [Cohaesibacter sp.]|nr:hypothetical protein [Cohaesibacter sp.]